LHVYSTTRATAETADDPANRSAIASRGEDVSASYGTVTERGIDVFVAGAYSYDPGMSAIYFPELEGRDEPCADARRRTMPMCTGVVFGSDTEEVANTYASIGYKDWKLHLLAS